MLEAEVIAKVGSRLASWGKGFRWWAGDLYNDGTESLVVSFLVVEPPWVRISAEDPVLRFAAAELIRYGTAAGRAQCVALAVDRQLATEFGPLARDCGYWIDPTGPRFGAAAARELLQAVYRYLGDLGWRWVLPGPRGEFWVPGGVPQRGEGPRVAERVLVERARVKHPGLWRAEMLALIDWMAKQGFTHLAIEGYELAPSEVRDLGRETARRGLALEIGGDLIGQLLARTHRAVEKGRRAAPFRRPGRVELADPEALTALPKVVADELARFEPATALRLAEPASPPLLSNRPDVLRPAERTTAVAAAAAAGLAGMGQLWVWQPGLAIRRTFQPPAGAGLVVPLRCQDRDRNADCMQTRWSRADGPEAWAGLMAAGHPVELALPYADTVAMGNLAAPLGEVIVADLERLAAAGARRISLPVQAGLSRWLYPFNLYVAARWLAGHEDRLETLRDEWCQALYGPAATEMATFLREFEEAIQPLLRLVGPSMTGTTPTPEDVGRVDRELAAATAQLARLAELAGRLETARRLAAGEAQVEQRLDEQAAAFTITTHLARLWLLRFQGSLSRPTLGLHGAAREQLARLEACLAGLPGALAAAAEDADFRGQVGRLARWCGYRGPLSEG